MKEQSTAKVLSAGRVTIPERFRLRLGLKVGDDVIVKLVDSKSILILPGEVIVKRTSGEAKAS